MAESNARRALEQVQDRFRQLENAFGDRRHPAFKQFPIKYEVYQFLDWLHHRVGAKTPVEETFLSNPNERERRVREEISAWLKVEDPAVRDERAERIRLLIETFTTRETLNETTIEDIKEFLQGMGAFQRQKSNFWKEENSNSVEKIRKSFEYLVFGAGDDFDRIEECASPESQYRLSNFGNSCVRELFGWAHPSGAPLNDRAIEAIGFLGFPIPKGLLQSGASSGDET